MIMLTYSATSQDSTRLPNSQLKAAIQEIERGRQAMREVELLRENETYYMKMLVERDSIISILRERERGYAAIGDGYAERLRLAEQQHQLTKDWAAELGSKLRKARRRTVLWAVGGVIATGASIYLLK